MTFFKVPPARPRAVSAPAVSGASGRGYRGASVDRAADAQAVVDEFLRQERERQEAMARAGQVEVAGQVLDGRSRPVGVATTKTKNNRLGLASTALCEGRLPRGMLFRLGPGFFDLDGFWCVPDNHGGAKVYRGASKGQRKHLSAEQRRILTAAQLRARKAGVR